MDKYVVFTCLQLVFIASYLYLRWKRHEGILSSLGISIVVVAAGIVAGIVLYWSTYAFICIFKEMVRRNTAAGVAFLVVTITLVIDGVVYGINKFRKWRYEQVRQKLSRLLTSK